METGDFGSLVLVGAIVSLLVEIVQKSLTKNRVLTMFAVIAGSIVAGSTYVYFESTPYWQTIIQVFISAGAVYTFIIKQVKTLK